MHSRWRANTLAYPDRLLIVASSGRALAQSARRGGWRVVVADLFADADTRAYADGVVKIATDMGAQTVCAALRAGTRNCVGLIYGGGMEARLSVLTRLGARCRVIGNAPEVARAAQSPRAFFALLDELGIPYPETRFDTPPGTARGWLVKRASGAGGLDVRRWDGARIDRDQDYLQRQVSGSVRSVLFAADGARAAIIGYNTQWVVGQGPLPFAYAGAINRARLTWSQRAAVAEYARAVTRALGLRGLNGLDFMLHRGVPLVLELNPRPTATCELYEMETPDGMVAVHLRACEGELPSAQVCAQTRVRAHRIVYARAAIHISHGWQWPSWCRDRPCVGTTIEAGAPICSVHAEGAEAAPVQRLLNLRREAMLRSLQPAIAA
jgi:uncharacterized protein